MVINKQREILIESLQYIGCNSESCSATDCGRCGELDKLDRCQIEAIADHLLADGWMRPPCKVGDFVWGVYSPKYPANPEDKGKWFMRQDGVQRIINGAKGFSIETWNIGTIPAKEIGSKLFLSEEEAIEVLRKKNDISISN